MDIRVGVEILLVASCYRNRDKRRPDGPLGSYTDFTYKGQKLFLNKHSNIFSLKKPVQGKGVQTAKREYYTRGFGETKSSCIH